MKYVFSAYFLVVPFLKDSPVIMHCTNKSLLVLLLFSGVVYVYADEKLVIDVLHKPEKCDRLTRKGDMLKMHYKGTLLDGSEFDSR